MPMKVNPRDNVWAWLCIELARRKVQFHPKEEWNDIKLWGLCNWGAIRKYVERGWLITDMKKENKVVWFRPTEEAWVNSVKPLVDIMLLSKFA